jgi:glycosyltransferase involved in cell wall biosynthesis
MPRQIGRRLRSLFLTTLYPRLHDPSEGAFVRAHARALAAHADVAVVHLDRAAATRGLADYERLLDEEPPPAWRYRYRRFGPPLSPLAFLAGPLVAYRRLAASGLEPDVVHAHSFLSALPALLLGRLHGKPVAYTEHWTIFLPENPLSLQPAMERLARLALRQADIVLPVSDDLRSALQELVPEGRYRVVPNAVPEDVFRPADATPRSAEPRLLTVGRLDSGHKGIDTLIEALGRIERPYRLDVVGEGPERPGYERLAQRVGVGDQIRFHDFEAQPKLASRMRGADLFVLASRYENNPCVLIEAMASGVPVVATRVGGVPEIVDADSGLLAPPDDPAALAARIDAALERLDGFDREAIARSAIERYGTRAVGRTLGDVYEELVRGR